MVTGGGMKIVRQLQERIDAGERNIPRRRWLLTYRVMRVLARDNGDAWDVLTQFRPIVTLPSERIARITSPDWDDDIPF